MTRRSFNLGEVLRRRDQIFAQVMQPQLGTTIDGPGLEQLTTRLLRVLPRQAERDTVFESIRYLAGQSLTEMLAWQVAWRFAGNIGRVKAREQVVPWTVQREDEWVPLQVLRCFIAKDQRDRLGYEMSFRVMAGTPAPMRIRAFWQIRVIKYVAARVGFTRPSGSYPFKKAEQLVGLRLLGLLDAARSRGAPEFHEIECPGSMVKWNRQNVLKLRFRDGVECPNGWSHPCHRCAVGYTTCIAATHRFDYQTGMCLSCHKEAAFDPEDAVSYYCIACSRRNRIRK